MVVDVLGPMMSVAVVTELISDLWAEPTEYLFFGTLGASGFWTEMMVRIRCTFTVNNSTSLGKPYA